MKVKILSGITSWKKYRNLEAGKIYDMPPEDAQKLVQGGQATEITEEGKPGAAIEPKTLPGTTKEVGGGAGPLIDPELAGWLSSKGFTRTPEGAAFVRTDRLETGDIVKLQVDFSDTPKGTRYGYRLDLSKDPPEWKSDSALHDHPLLLQFKRFRDDLLAQRERELMPEKGALTNAVPPGDRHTEVPAGGGTKLALRPPKEEEEEVEEIVRRDDALIIREVKGDLKVLERALADYFYSFELHGRTVRGLSYSGVKAIIRRMGKIENLEIKIEEKPDSWFVIIKSHDKVRDLQAYGTATQLKHFPSGGVNPYARTIAVSKAQRNAWRHFIDEKVVTETYRAWLEERGKK